MKTSALIAILAFGLMTMGCAKQGSPADSAASSAAVPSTAPYVNIPTDGSAYVPPGAGPGTGPGANLAQYGATANLTFTSLSTLQQYTGRQITSYNTAKVNVNLVQSGNTYGGTVSVGYNDCTYGNCQAYQGTFTSGRSANLDPYNVFFTFNGRTVFHGFFEDYLGGLILVINTRTDSNFGDGVSNQKVGGSVWFRNFGATYAPHPPTYCWFVSLGPYDCRSWPNGNGVNTTQADIPNNGYVQLGTFVDLNLTAAFNGAPVSL